MYTAHEVILSYMTLSENKGQVGYPLLHEALKTSWYSLFKKTKESIVRKWVEVNTGGIVDYPNTLERLRGVYVVDNSGNLSPLYEDTAKNILEPPKKKCSCNSCDSNECLCPTIQEVPVITDIEIDGVPYQNKTITRVLKNGNVIEEKTIWVPDFDFNGNFVTAKEVKTETEKCKVDVKSCGCPLDTEENAEKLFRCGCMIDYYVPWMKERYAELYNEVGYYKTDDETREIHLFDSSGRKSRLKKVKLVFQSNGADMMVPEYAELCLKALLHWTRMMYSPSFQPGDRNEAKKNFKWHKKEMIKELNPIPYEWFVQVGEYPGNLPKRPYYIRPHSDFVRPEVIKVCDTTKPDNITNITNTTVNAVAARYLRKIVDAESDSPVSGLDYYQHIDLVGLGNNSDDKIEIVIDKINMYNWGPVPDFTFDKALGKITGFVNGYTWQPQATLKVDLTQ